ncbi:hypothetical protein MKW98_026816 [Papaver atlanticum]|uniref:Uncharacterized protein n=1 Tax=Papaver atlanticum TaxID=357466 RepID=A0AAD4X5K6_9MAGN|nr:hypothetical protein MKW98_026816 [Papaver atlanticum]
MVVYKGVGSSGQGRTRHQVRVYEDLNKFRNRDKLGKKENLLIVKQVVAANCKDEWKRSRHILKLRPRGSHRLVRLLIDSNLYPNYLNTESQFRGSC